MTYKDAIKYINSFQNLEEAPRYNHSKSFNLERISRLCEIIGRPQDDYKSILVSGTNGKGSVCAILRSILTSAGYKIGLYTSPHLFDLRERIKINNRCISEQEFSELITKIKEAISYAKTEDIAIYKKLTFFEILTAMSLLYFSEKNIDFAIFEAGLGGRLDATNINSALVSVITSIGHDHTRLLGKSLHKIAKEKAGILKENSFAITSQQEPKALQAIEAAAKAKDCQLFIVGKDIKYNCNKSDARSTCFDYNGIYGNYKGLSLSLIGRHQAENAAIALAVTEILNKIFYFSIDAEHITSGLKKVKWPARFDIIARRPRLIIDCAHNEEAALILKDTIFGTLGKKRIHSLILGICSDKDIKAIGSILCPIAKNVIFTESFSRRSASAVTLSRQLSRQCENSFIVINPKSALSLARRLTPENSIILAAGSIYLAGDIMRINKVEA